MSEEIAGRLREHLVRADGQEDVCFALWRPSTGTGRTTAVLMDVLLPLNGERHIHGNASFESGYFLRAAAHAAEVGAGLALLHSHPDSTGWQGMSDDDHHAEAGNAAQAVALTGLPLVGLTHAVADGGWSARFWDGGAAGAFDEFWCESVRVVGQGLSVTWNPSLRPAPLVNARQLRTGASWGAVAQSDLARLHVGVVGLGSVGSIIAEALARMGVERISLFDFDAIETHNLDRTLHATASDLGIAKVVVAAAALEHSSTAEFPRIVANEWGVTEEPGFRAALDCDVLFSCVDRPWPRAVLNLMAYSHLIPVVDGGIAVEIEDDVLVGARWKAHVVGPGRRCLECLEQYDSGLVDAERSGLLDDPEYVRGLPPQHPVRRNQNVFAFSLGDASLELMQFLRMIIQPLGIGDTGGDAYQFVLGRLEHDLGSCQPSCLYSGDLLCCGDRDDIRVTGDHAAAAAARRARATHLAARPEGSGLAGWVARLGRWLRPTI